MKFPKPRPGQGWASRFHWQLETIERAYKASRLSPDGELADVSRRVALHERRVAAGEASWADYDDDGYPGFDYGESLGEEIYAQEQVLSLVRLAFLITLYHYWEQQLTPHLERTKKGQTRYDEDEAFAWLEAFGWHPQRAALTELRLIANCAKHSEGSSATELFSLRPDLFDAHQIEKWELLPGYDTLRISDAVAESYFEAVRTSVPRMPLTL